MMLYIFENITTSAKRLPSWVHAYVNVALNRYHFVSGAYVYLISYSATAELLVAGKQMRRSFSFSHEDLPS